MAITLRSGTGGPFSLIIYQKFYYTTSKIMVICQFAHCEFYYHRGYSNFSDHP